MSELRMESMAETDAAPAAAAAVPLPLPGEALRAARSSAGLGVDDVARALKFSARQVLALEADDYQTLQGATFIRGFVRSYAKFLRLDPLPLLALLDQTLPASPIQVATPMNMGEASPKPLIERYQRQLVLALILLVVAVIAAYLYTREEFSAAAEGGADAPPQAAVSDPAPAPVSPAPTVVAAPVSAAPSAVAPATAPPSATPAVPSIVPPAAPAASAVVPATPATPVAVPGERQITLDFDGRSWVEIKDAARRVVLTGEFSGGTRQQVSGKPPFTLWIGKASAVRVNYGDKRVDLAPYSREDVARMTLE